jgi:hypothetical protein
LEGLKDVGPNLGVAPAAGKAGVEVLKQTNGMAPLSRMAIVGSSAAATAAGTKLGLDLGKQAIDNTTKSEGIATQKSKLDESSEDGINSPSYFNSNSGFINSILEDSEIPLIGMVNGLSFLNYIEFSLILSLFSLLFRKFLIRKLTSIILKLIQKIQNIQNIKKTKDKEVESIKDKEVKEAKEDKDKNVTLNQALNTLDKYTDFIIVFIFICFFWILTINIFFSNNLAANIDSSVNVYNHIKNQ